MKTLKGFMRTLRSKPLLLELFDSAESIYSNFEKEPDSDIVFCYAWYEYECYSGSAAVIFYRKSTKKYYEVHGSHCSCYGLEGQWERDEEINFVELESRMQRGYFVELSSLYRAYLRS